MEQRTPTIYQLAEEAARQQKKAQPETGEHKLTPNRKVSARTSRPAPEGPKRRRTPRRKPR